MIFKNNDELKAAVKDGVLDCKGEDLFCRFNIDVDAHIINAGNINAGNIKAGNIDAWNIKAGNIDAWNIKAGNIDAWNINAWNINAGNIDAWNIKAGNIDAWNISYFAFCVAYKKIGCVSIKGRRKNSKHFCLDGKITIKEKGAGK